MERVIMFIIPIGLLLAGIYSCQQAIWTSNAQAEAQEVEWVAKAVEEGQSSPQVSVSCQEVLPAIAADPKCCANIEKLYFMTFDLDFDPDFDYSPIKKLSRLEFMFFYCFDSDPVLRAASGMESIEALSFELCGSSPEGLKLLTTFPNLKKVSFTQAMSPEEIELIEETLPGVELVDPYEVESEAVDEVEENKLPAQSNE
jgi:hypothetical protein